MKKNKKDIFGRFSYIIEFSNLERAMKYIKDEYLKLKDRE